MERGENLSGRLLIASPHLQDGHFLRTVLLIVRHDDEGALGFVLNRPTAKRLREVVEWDDGSSPPNIWRWWSNGGSPGGDSADSLVMGRPR